MVSNATCNNALISAQADSAKWQPASNFDVKIAVHPFDNVQSSHDSFGSSLRTTNSLACDDAHGITALGLEAGRYRHKVVQ